MAAIDYDKRIAELQAQITQLEAERATQASWRQSRAARVQDWGINTPQGQESQAEVVAADNRIADIDRRLSFLKSELAKAMEARDAIAAATAQAVAQGLTPEAAKAQAEANYARSEGIKRFLTYAGIGLLVVLLIIAFVYWRKSRK